ncbi:large subunit ribosomal protein L18Ae [Vigna unguiculata]|uniref:Large subunit ribosomal protein L18Ae n=1 Tax=Vigna unguiculata TaxID=3917 RepID=A0A4D6MT13_VIGUN|nr:large subunit ribosomal protein L18Ae [Vigna unguiculata]
MYNEMASRHRVRSPCIQIIKTATIPANFAKGRAPSNSSTPKSSSLWCSRGLGPQLGSSEQHTRHPSPTCSCNSQCATFSTFHREVA